MQMMKELPARRWPDGGKMVVWSLWRAFAIARVAMRLDKSERHTSGWLALAFALVRSSFRSLARSFAYEREFSRDERKLAIRQVRLRPLSPESINCWAFWTGWRRRASRSRQVARDHFPERVSSLARARGFFSCRLALPRGRSEGPKSTSRRPPERLLEIHRSPSSESFAIP